jgi:hypothetical protein
MPAASKVELMDDAERARIREIVKAEFSRHTWNTFVDEPPSLAQGGRGVVVPGCSMCRVRCQTVSQFTEHLSEAVWAAVESQLEIENTTDQENVEGRTR